MLFLSSWKNTREKFSTGCEGFLFVPFVPDSKKTKQMMKIKHPRVFFQNRGQRGQIRRLFSFPKCLFFLYLRAFLHFSSVFLSRGQRGQKRAEGTKICPFSASFAVFTPVLCFSSLSPLSAPRPVNVLLFFVFPQKKQALEACGWKNGQQKKAGWRPACKNSLRRLGRRLKRHSMGSLLRPDVHSGLSGVISAVCPAG